jgi:hypothetical protein
MQNQTVFGWFEGCLNRSGVLSLCVFKPEVIKESGRVVGGQAMEFAYSTWLKWFSPLSHSGFASQDNGVVVNLPAGCVRAAADIRKGLGL